MLCFLVKPPELKILNFDCAQIMLYYFHKGQGQCSSFYLLMSTDN